MDDGGVWFDVICFRDFGVSTHLTVFVVMISTEAVHCTIITISRPINSTIMTPLFYADNQGWNVLFKGI
jgi:hypothetical protein